MARRVAKDWDFHDALLRRLSRQGMNQFHVPKGGPDRRTGAALQTEFDPSLKLDASQVEDRRGTLESLLLSMKMGTGPYSYKKAGSDTGGRPSPRQDSRPGAQGSRYEDWESNLQDLEPEKKTKTPRHLSKNAAAGDGRLERPAPKLDNRPAAAGKSKKANQMDTLRAKMKAKNR